MSTAVSNNSGIFDCDHLQRNRTFYALMIVAMEELNVSSFAAHSSTDTKSWLDEKMSDATFIAGQRQAEMHWTDLAAKANRRKRKRNMCAQKENEQEEGHKVSVETSERVFATIVETAKQEAKRALGKRQSRELASLIDAASLHKKRRVVRKHLHAMQSDKETENVQDNEMDVLATPTVIGRLVGSWKLPTSAMLENKAFNTPRSPDTVFVGGQWVAPTQAILCSDAYKAPHPPSALFVFERR